MDIGQHKTLRVIGLMSGTSLDGVDAAWIETDGETIAATGPAVTLPYDAKLRADLRALLDRAPTLRADDADLRDAERRLTERHAEAIATLAHDADMVGFHGQTILHRPQARRTWQIGDAPLLSRLTGLPVVHDFRTADVAAGGQGAPFAPALHAALARDLPKPIAVLNIGGVANVTWIGPTGIGPTGIGEGDDLVAFDTGPGNGPLDDWVTQHTGQAMDAGGALAAAGRADPAVLARLLAHPYFALPAPKSLDRLDFGRAIAASGLSALGPADGAATLVAFIAGAVAAAPLPSPPTRWLVTGGGRHNPAIMAALASALPAPVAPVEAVGWDGDAIEAQCFGYLAARSLRGLPLSYPGTTGVSAPLTGGRLTTA
jgi:anhydro-N-acetylmuramic acid kinase